MLNLNFTQRFMKLKRHTLILALVIISYFKAPLAEAMEPCSVPCPQGRVAVAQLFAMRDAMRDPTRRLAVENWFRPPSHLLIEPVVPVVTIEDIRTRLVELSNQCKQVHFLGLVAHGALGGLVFGDKVKEHNTVSVSNLNETLGGVSCVMAPQGTIDIVACQVAKYCSGQQFISELGRLLMPQGGTIQATTEDVSNYELLLFKKSLNLLTLTIHENGSGETWSRPVPDFAQCKKELFEEWDNVIAKNPQFFSSDQRKDRLSRELAELDEALAFQPNDLQDPTIQRKLYIEFGKAWNSLYLLKRSIKRESNLFRLPF